MAALTRDAKSAKTVGEADHSFRWPFRNAFIWGLLATGFVLLGATGAMSFFIPEDSISSSRVFAACIRGILLILLIGWLLMGLAIEHIIERRRAPYNPLRRRIPPTFAIVATLLLVGGMVAWGAVSGLRIGSLFTRSYMWWSSPIVLDPAFLYLDQDPFWDTVGYAFSFGQYSWELGFSKLLIVVTTAMVLSSVAFVIVRLVRYPALAAGMIAALPFVLVPVTYGPVQIYWTGSTVLLSIVLFAISRSCHLSSSMP